MKTPYFLFVLALFGLAFMFLGVKPNDDASKPRYIPVADKISGLELRYNRDRVDLDCQVREYAANVKAYETKLK